MTQQEQVWLRARANALAAELGPDLPQRIVQRLYRQAEAVSARVVRQTPTGRADWDRRLDDVLTSPRTGYLVMLLVLGLVFWVTVVGANYPSSLLAASLFWGEEQLTALFAWLGAPAWLHGFVILGVYRGLAWVVSVMLPPMAIFFPLFMLLEDFGYLPRVAFNLDHFFKKAGAHGKQGLTMSMGFGCNAAGVVACRIIESPRERLIATLTNTFVPCNGRFPTLIVLATIFMGGVVAGTHSSAVAAATVVGMVLVGIAATLLVSWALSKTLLRGVPSSFTLELPPYRAPRVGRVLVRSLLDRTLFVLRRAVVVAAPAGGVTWVLANVQVGSQSALAHLVGWLQPFGHAIGLDGFIVLAFLLGLAANEIVLPILFMSYLSAGALVEMDSLEAIRRLLVDDYGWTWLTALCMMLFSVLHFPCGTTLWTVYRETRSVRWTLIAGLLPFGIATAVCFLVAQSVRALGGLG
ncbi:MAG: nucleoside recognition domain-containing protein [Terriglobia bacterium]